MIDYTHLITSGGYTRMEFFKAEKESSILHRGTVFIDGHSRPLGVLRSVVRSNYYWSK